jgi:hypothetical protein
VLAAYDQYICVGLIGWSRPQDFQSLAPQLESVFNSIHTPEVNPAAMQQLVGKWQGVSTRQSMTFYGGDGSQISGAGGPVSSELFLILHLNGTCESNSFVAVSGSTGDASPMAGWSEHQVDSTAGGTFGQIGRYLVAGNRLYVVEPNSRVSYYDLSEPGVLNGAGVRYVRVQ